MLLDARNLDRRTGWYAASDISLFLQIATAARGNTTSQIDPLVADPELSIEAQIKCSKQVKLFYRTSWGRAWMHGSIGGDEWQDHQLLPVRANLCCSISSSLSLKVSGKDELLIKDCS